MSQRFSPSSESQAARPQQLPLIALGCLIEPARLRSFTQSQSKPERAILVMSSRAGRGMMFWHRCERIGPARRSAAPEIATVKEKMIATRSIKYAETSGGEPLLTLAGLF